MSSQPDATSVHQQDPSTAVVSTSVECGCFLDDDSTVLLLEAAQDGLLDLVQYAMECGARRDIPNAAGETALRLAARNGHWDVVHFLTSLGSEVQQVDELFWAGVECGHADTVRLMLEGRADVEQKGVNSTRALIVAAQNGHAEVVVELLGARANLHCTDPEGRTALDRAAQNGHAAVVQLLLQAMPEAGALRSLFAAVDAGDVEAVSLLIQVRAAVDGVNKDGHTPLYATAQNGNVEVARQLVLAQAVVDKADRHGCTPLRMACYKGHLAMVKLLVKAGAAVNWADRWGWTPLYVAAFNSHLEVARHLVAAQATVDYATQDGRTPLYVAVLEGHLEMSQLLVMAQAAVDHADREGRTPLLVACCHGRAALATLLVAARAEVGQASIDGRTPLYAAAENGNLEVVRQVLSAQATVDQLSNNGRTPLSVACEKGRHDVAVLLARAGAALDSLTHQDVQAGLWSACQDGHAEVTTLLLAAQADVHQTNKDGSTPLWIACANGHIEVAKLLFKAQGDINLATEVGLTPLLMAAREGHLLLVRWLLSASSYHDHIDSEGHSPLWVAVQNQHPDCVESLLEGGAPANTQHPHTGQTALMCAAATGDRRTIELLQSCGARADLRDKAGFTTHYHADPDVEELFVPPRLEQLLELCGDPDAVNTAALAEVLQDPSVNVNAGDKYLHWTALMEAVLFGRPEAVRCLLAHGADPEVQMFCGLTAAFWAQLRNDATIRAALGDGVVLSTTETAGLAAVCSMRQQSREADELLAFDGGGNTQCRGEGRKRAICRVAHLSVQDRMADVTTDTEEGRFYPEGYKCLVSLYYFLTTGTEFHKPLQQRTAGDKEALLTLNHMVVEGRKVVTVQVAIPNIGVQLEERICPPEDVFALFCYTFESPAYQRSNWAMRHWDRSEAQATLELWRPFIYHCERAVRRLPQRFAIVYRGIPIPFESKFAGRFVWPSFSSTSESLKVAKNFALKQSKALIFIILGRSGASIRHCSRYQAEAEVLFPPNLRLKTRWLSRPSVLTDTKVLLGLPDYANLPPHHRLTPEEAVEEAVVVVYCEEW
eukprot:EG_transcript_1258